MVGGHRYGLVGLTFLLAIGLVPTRAQATTVAEYGEPTGALEIVLPAVNAFDRAFETFSGCLGEPTVLFEDLPGRKGEYRVGISTIALNPNRATQGMDQVVVHELAHHLMISCEIDKNTSFRDAFYASQGIPPTRGWYDYSAGWSEAPAEQFAEAVSLYVLSRNTNRIVIQSATLTEVAELALPAVVVSQWVPKAAADKSFESAANRMRLTSRSMVEAGTLLGLPSRTRFLGTALGRPAWRKQ